MKKISIITLTFFLSFYSYSQAPQKFTYQSIVKAEDGRVLKSSSLGIKLSVLKNSENGVAVYSEVHSASTNTNGLVTLLIGDGMSSDVFSNIDWSTGQYFLKVEVDPLGGINYTIEQSSQLLSVPYALYASNSSNIDLDKDVKGILPISGGGTNSATAPMIGLVTAADAAAARTVMGVDPSGTDNSTNVSLATVTGNYLSVDGQEITAATVPVTLGGTGSTTASAARTALSAQTLDTQLTELSGITPAQNKIITGNAGGEFIELSTPMIGVISAADATAARTSMGLGTMSTQNKGAVDIDGGDIDSATINNSDLTGTSKYKGVALTVEAAEINMLDGNTTQATVTLQGTDGVVISDGVVMKQALVSDFATYVGAATSMGGLSDVSIQADNSFYIGHVAATANDADENLSIGVTALDAITEGDNNVAIGHNALTTNTTGEANLAIGTDALKSNLGGSGNVAFGDNALEDNIAGEYNVAIGDVSLTNVTGDSNIGIGAEAGKIITTGDGNTLIGDGADVNSGNVDAQNQIVIGSSATSTGTDRGSAPEAETGSLHFNHKSVLTNFSRFSELMRIVLR